MTLQNTKSLKKQVAPFRKINNKRKFMANHQHRCAIYYIMVLRLYKSVCFLLVSLSTDYRYSWT